MSCLTFSSNNGINQNVIDQTAPHIDGEATLRICFCITMLTVVRPWMRVTCVADFVTVKLASSVNSIVTDLLRALLSNGSVNKPNQRDCFLCGPFRNRC
jgi:hypothetical protein